MMLRRACSLPTVLALGCALACSPASTTTDEAQPKPSEAGVATPGDPPVPSPSFCGKPLKPDTTQVECEDPGLADLSGLQDLEQLGYVKLQNATLSEAIGQDAAMLSGLHMFDCLKCEVDGAGLAHVSKAEQLIGLHLRDSKITDAELRSLATMPYLRELTLSGTQVTDAGLGALQGFTKLDFLKLASTDITGVGLSKLGDLRLRHIDLSNTALTPEGVSALAGMDVAAVDLRGTKLSLAALKPLKDVERLYEIRLSPDALPDDELEELRALLGEDFRVELGDER